MKKYFYLIVLLLFSCAVKAQSAEDSVKAVINKMFAAMKNADSKSFRECFTDSAIFQSVIEKEGKVSVGTESFKEFLEFIDTQKKGDMDEQITFDVVRTEGPLGTAWTPYNFYYQQKFSHCGADSYQLVRINGEWKIQYLIDTRSKTRCKQ